MKLLKKSGILALILVVCFGCCLLTGCPAPGNEIHDYTITVVDESGNPIAGVKLQPCLVNKDGNLGLCYDITRTTDENGKAYYESGDFPVEEDEDGNVIENDHYEFHVAEMPEGYEEDVSKYAEGTEGPRLHKGGSGTITLIKKRHNK